MEHFKWLLIKKYKEFNENIVVKSLKKSFIFNLFKASIIIFLLILLLFQVKPQKAYIYAEVEQEQINEYSLYNESYFWYNAKTFEVNDISGDYISIWSADKIVIELNGLSINDVDYSVGECLVIDPIDKKNSYIGSSYIEFLGAKDSAFFNDATSLSYNAMDSKYSSYTFVGEQYLSIGSGTAYILDTNGDKKELDNTEKLVLMNSHSKDLIDLFQESIDNITENDGSISDEHKDDYMDFNQIIDRERNKHYTIHVYAEPIGLESKNAELSTSYKGCKNITLIQVVSCIVRGNGKLTISYTPTPEEYSLKKQDLFLLSENSSLTLSVDVETGKVSIWGYADKAMLSQMSLFPSLWNWYFSNIYMAPLTLISTVFAAVSMMNASKKKQMN